VNRPGLQLRAIAARLFDRSTLERLVDPLIADLQFEHAEAMRHGHLWRARWSRVAGCIAFWKVAIHAWFATNWQAARAIAVAFSTGMLITTLAVLVVLANTPATVSTQGKMAWLVLYLLPQGLAIGLPICLASGLFIWLRGEGADASRHRTVLRLMRLALVLGVVNAGWIAPAANNTYRNLVSARLALAIAPMPLGVLALAGAKTGRRRSAAIVVLTTLTLFAGCYLLFSDNDIATLMRWIPALAIAWIPDAIVAVAIGTLAGFQSVARV
jgi:hypothetical protein